MIFVVLIIIFYLLVVGDFMYNIILINIGGNFGLLIVLLVFYLVVVDIINDSFGCEVLLVGYLKK